MRWTQVWLPSAKSTWLRLKLAEQAKIARYVEAFAAKATIGDVCGHLKVGRWWVGLHFEADANYIDDSGDEASGDVVWVYSLYVPPPDDVDDSDLYPFDIDEYESD